MSGADDATRVEENRRRAREQLKQLAAKKPIAATPASVRDASTRDATVSQSANRESPTKRRLGDYIEFDLTRLHNSRGGFLVEESNDELEALEERRKERERELQRMRDQMEPGISLDPSTRPVCESCGTTDIIFDPFQRVFGVFVCRPCERANPERYSLLTKTEVKDDYLLTDAELGDQELLPHLLKRNPHKSTYSSMMLFMRGQVEAYAFSEAKWKSPEGLDAEYERRQAEKSRKRVKRFNEGLDRLRKSTIRSNVWQARQDAEHSGPQLITHLPDASADALKTFEEIPACIYQSARMGRIRGHDDPACECSLANGIAYACTDEANCINRLTQVECMPDVCACRKHCKNQRFQRCEYAPVDIVHMPKKGFGLRAAMDLEADTFVYEYIGDVVNHETFLRRMHQYKEEHIEHFYFMMLQKDEYIDATRRGARSRFINHSCNPNCYVSKWHVGKQVRMGIFTKRTIVAGEELTFNYNVDRYGNDPQECHCGEPNCVGTIGGRTQTDIVTMDDLYIEALGIAEEVARIRATLPRGKRSKVLDEDYNPVLHPMTEPEAPRVVTAMRQACSNRNILKKLLTRVTLTDDVSAHKSMVKLHGFVVMSDVLHEWAHDAEIVTLALECLRRWPLLARDKALDSGVEAAVREYAAGAVEFEGKADEAHISEAASALVAGWEKLSTTLRIARREALEDASFDADASFSWTERRRAAAAQLAQKEEAAEDAAIQLREALLAYRNQEEARAEVPKAPSPNKPAPKAEPAKPTVSLEDIIRKANEEEERRRIEAQERAEQEKAAAEAAAKAEAEALAERKRQRKEAEAERKRRRLSGTKDKPKPERKESESTAHLERQLQKMVGAIVVKHMSKVKDRIARDRFKRHARELTSIICAKEMKNPRTWPPPRGKSGHREIQEFSDEKRAKIKRFAHEYTKKLLKHHKKPEKDAKEESAHGSPEGGDTTVDVSLSFAASPGGPDTEALSPMSDGSAAYSPASRTASPSASP
ncbi:[histone H3]-lysine(4) N-trimethyltransferase [Malassezia cuniculi]|uniref:Histone-lysine N-methyltransferase, H3 lysine-36 specific n=1 Tax=Malassezia cuniculi TaxID=948313 RepID=A0AAF0J7Y8_9BASI|nr:[histone H3]-lysine(4) N-trimethyltransferase [Malassezia cuniculi]